MSDHAITSTLRDRGQTIEGGFAAALRIWWERLDEQRRIRVTINALHALDDRSLKDIGLERGDIEAAVNRRCARK